MKAKDYLKRKEMYYCVACSVRVGKEQDRCENCHHNIFEVHYLQYDVMTALEINSETSHNSRKNQLATDYIHRYETRNPAVTGTRELIHFVEWLLKEVAD